MGNIGIYLHIPFCRTKCSYCSFVIRPWRADLAERYSRALVRELRLFFSGARPSDAVDSIFLGGGTPSLVPARQIEDLLSVCRELLDISDDCEVTLEANPGTLTKANLDCYLHAGVNRISLGAQSFDDRELAAIGRDHSAEEIENSLSLLRRHGIHNISLDLLLGLPGQTATGWRRNLDRLARLSPPHVSLYMLDMDGKSALYHQVARGQLVLPEADLVAEWYFEGRERLISLGYSHYEISNFARGVYSSRHNLKYWLRQPVLGFGLGSHSFDGSSRYANHSRMERYLALTEHGRSPVEWRRLLSRNDDLSERLFLGLRLGEGIDWPEIVRDFHPDPLQGEHLSLSRLSEEGLLEWDPPRFRLTPRGILLSNEVFEAFV